MRPDIYKITAIGTGFLAAMAKPVPGEFIKEEFAGIANEGINQIVSLLEKHEEYSVGLSEEQLLSLYPGNLQASSRRHQHCGSLSRRNWPHRNSDGWNPVARRL